MKIPMYSAKPGEVYYSYVILLDNGEYYVGSTSDLDKRWYEHNNPTKGHSSKGSKKTRENKPVAIVYHEKHPTRLEAVKKENVLKRKFLNKAQSGARKKGDGKMKKRKSTAKKRSNPKRKASRRKVSRRRVARKPVRRRVSRRRVKRAVSRRRNAPLSLRRRNPGAKRRRRRSYRMRRNPALPKMFRFMNKNFLMRSTGIAGGVAGGYLAMPLWMKLLPESVTSTNRRFLGILNIVLGGVIFTMSKKTFGRDLGMSLSGTGVYDLLAKMIPDLGLPALPSSSSLIDQVMPTKEPESVGANYYPHRSLNASYTPPVSRRVVNRLGANFTPSRTVGVPALFGNSGSPDMSL